MLNILYSFLGFLSAPDRLTKSSLPIKKQFVEILMLFAMVFGIVILISAPLMSLAGVDEIPHKLEEFMNSLNLFDNAFLKNLLLFGIIVVAGPLIEEIFFRFPLKYRRGALTLGAAFFGVVFYGAIMRFGFESTQAGLISFVAALIGLVTITLFNRTEDQLNSTSNKFFPWLFYTTAIMFAFIHIFNFELDGSKWMFAPILVLPQFLLGLMLGYSRIKYGFWACLFLHGLNNFIPFLVIVFFPEAAGM